MECSTAVKDVDLARGQLAVRGGKGDKDRFVMLPESARDALGRSPQVPASHHYPSSRAICASQSGVRGQDRLVGAKNFAVGQAIELFHQKGRQVVAFNVIFGSLRFHRMERGQQFIRRKGDFGGRGISHDYTGAIHAPMGT